MWTLWEKKRLPYQSEYQEHYGNGTFFATLRTDGL
jgi:hypothetical protein